MRNQHSRSRQILLGAVLLIVLTIIYGFFIHDLLAVSWQKFVDFFFYILLLASVFVIVQQFYLWHFRYLNLSESRIQKMSYDEFVDLIAHLSNKMGYTSIKRIKNNFFDLSLRKEQQKYVLFCYHKRNLTTTPIIKNARVIFITDYELAPYEIEKLSGSNWQIIEHDEFYRLLNQYLV